MSGSTGEDQMIERWRDLARRLDAGETRPDPILDFVLERLTPEMTVVDIGAGVGRWTIPLAGCAREVTAVEPVEGMRNLLEARVASRQLKNVQVVADGWLEAELAPHDAAVAAYSMYTSPDIVAFARKMEDVAHRFCAMAMRLPASGGVVGELSEKIYGEWHDSTNFIVGYNALLEAGFAPNVFIEAQPLSYWTDATLESGAARARRHLRLADDRFDALIAETLKRRLVETRDGYRWPDWMRAGLIWWKPAKGM